MILNIQSDSIIAGHNEVQVFATEDNDCPLGCCRRCLADHHAAREQAPDHTLLEALPAL